MKLHCILSVCLAACISSQLAVIAETNKTPSERIGNSDTVSQYGLTDQTNSIHQENIGNSDAVSQYALTEQPINAKNGAAGEDISHTTNEKNAVQKLPEIQKQHFNKSESSVAGQQHVLANNTETSSLKDDEDVETPKPYDVKHYLTAEQKYHMLKVNLLGIGITVVHGIIPIPVANAAHYKKSMDKILENIQAAREASANITSGNTHNITLEEAHKLKMEMEPRNKTGSAKTTKKKPVSRKTEVSIILLHGL